MSLTSYRAAPPRGIGGQRTDDRGRRKRELRRRRQTRRSVVCGLWSVFCRLVLARPGGDLLFRVLRRSTIGAEGFHGRVRDGIGCLSPRHDHQAEQGPEDSGRTTEVGRVSSCGLVAACDGFRRRLSPSPRDDGLRHRAGIKPIERLVPVGWSVAALIPPAYRRDGLSRLLGETWF